MIGIMQSGASRGESDLFLHDNALMRLNHSDLSFGLIHEGRFEQGKKVNLKPRRMIENQHH